MSERHDWLNLIEVSGPFLSIPVLDEAFPQGLEGRDKRDAARLRQAYDEWHEAVDVDDPSLDELHRAWVDEVLGTALQMGDRDLRRGDEVGDAMRVPLPEHGVTLIPDIVLVNVNDTDKPLLPMIVQPPNAPLDEVVHRDGWAASPAERMLHYLRGVDCPIGLVTNGERWMLVHAPAGQVTSFVSWYARLWSQEPETLRAFVSLLAVPRFYGPEEGQLPSLFAKSEKHQDEVTEALGDQVRTAIEVLIQAIDKANQDRNGKLLDGVTPQELYEGGLTVMMRLVFILSAEERGLLLLGNTTYDNHYALSTFRQRLRRVSSNAHELLERRHAGWSRLLALFRAIYGGIEHSDLRLPAMGGGLFDPDRYPFLEGRAKGSSWLTDAADPLPIDDRTVLLMLDAIQSFEGRTLSYRALDVEQIGHVYEGLLERTVRQIGETTLELRGSAQVKSPKATLRELAEAGLDGQEKLIELLKERTGRSVPALRRDLQRSRDDRLSAALLTACRGEVGLHDRVEPYVHLMALDPWDHPRLYHPGAYAVVMGSDRRETGTHYTPKSLTEKIVHETLTPVAYVGPAEGKPKEEWQLKSPAELLDLKVCDPAMGSGAFLVQACRWLGERLVEAWNQAEASGDVVSVDGSVLENTEESELLPRDAEERTVIARRLVAERCLYGVDMNPLAVELAKLSIWLVTLAEGRPFGFLDHNLRCGDSLLGIARLEQLTELSLEPSDVRQSRLFGQSIREALDQALELRRRLRETPIRDIHDVEAMATLDTKARKQLELPERIADAFIGAVFTANSPRVLDERISSLAIQADQAVQGDTEVLRGLVSQSNNELAKDAPDGQPRRPFHWPLEFPEVFIDQDIGFDAIVGNPPFMGGTLISGRLGKQYQSFIKKQFAGSASNGGRGDLCAYFFLRASNLLGSVGVFGLIGAKAVCEGDTRSIGLYEIVKNDFCIYRAKRDVPWPGAANVTVALVWVSRAEWHGVCCLNDVCVSFISSALRSSSTDESEVYPLSENVGLACEGVRTIGMGFIIDENEAIHLIDECPSDTEVILPFVDGKDINSNPAQKAARYCIFFGDWSEEQARKYKNPWRIVEERVKPERQRVKPDGAFKLRSPMPQRYWQFGDARMSFRNLTKRLERIIVIVQTSKYVAATFQHKDRIFSQSLVMVASEDYGIFAIINSSVHSLWIQETCSNMGATQRYIVSDGFNTYPFSVSILELRSLGQAYEVSRAKAMREYSMGLTDVYNSMHDPACLLDNIVQLRDLQVKIDKAVAKSYGWHDLDLEHDFYNLAGLRDRDEVRFTISEGARSEVVSRLKKINHQRHEKELAQGLHGSKTKRASSRAPRLQRAANANTAQSHLNFESSQVADNGGESPFKVVFNFLKQNDGWHSKADIIAASGLTDSHWTPTIRELINRGLVERQGERRGARYRAVRND